MKSIVGKADSLIDFTTLSIYRPIRKKSINLIPLGFTPKPQKSDFFPLQIYSLL
jgi:hypothetical protein